MSDYPSLPPPPPTYPGYPAGGSWQEPPRPARPTTVSAAFALMMLHCVFSVVTIVLVASQADELKRTVLKSKPNASQATLDAIVPIAIGIAVAGLVLYLGLALFVRAGRNWARIVTWVFAGLGLLGFVIGLARPTLGADRALQVIGAVIDVAIVVLLARGPSNEFFRPRARYG